MSKQITYAPRRRYRIGDHPAYDKEFDRCKANSSIFNSMSPNSPSAWITYALQSKSGLQSLISRWKGDADGFFMEKGNKVASILKGAEMDLEKVDTDFERFRQQKINEGRMAPSTMPEEMLEQKLKGEARLDLVQSEVADLERRLSRTKDVETKISRDAVLPRGPAGWAKLLGGILVVVDGQSVAPDKRKVLHIDDERSPYHGLATSVYFEKIVKPWSRQKAKVTNEFRKQAEADPAKFRDLKAPGVPWPTYDQKSGRIVYPWIEDEK